MLLLLAPGLLAAAPGDRIGRRLQAIDTDRNGMISRAEAQASPELAAGFDAIDANRDGQITPAELRAWNKGRGTRNETRRGTGGLDEEFARADRNADGVLSRAEVEQGMPRAIGRFDVIDADRDGYISTEELRAHLRARRDARDTKPKPQPGARIRSDNAY